LKAHSPLISTVAIIKSKENTWSMHISASLSAFQYALTNDDRSLQLDSISSDLFQQRVIDLLRRKLRVQIPSGVNIILEDGIVKLGHETEVVFKLSVRENNPRSIKIKNESFLSIAEHYCVVKVITPDGASSNILLEKGNEYSVEVFNSKNGYTLANPSIFNWKLIPVGVFLLISISLFVIKKSKNLVYFKI
jgi:hypothetical protein